MSQTAVPSPLPSWGREMPRWSLAGQPVLSPASMAGLPESRAWVRVGPPLAWRGPRRGSVLVRSVALLVGGGVLYTLGGVVYALRWPDPHPRVFGYHETFHLLVIGGTALHYWLIVTYLAG